MAVTDVNKPERIEIVSTDKTVHFTEQIQLNGCEKETILLPTSIGIKSIIHGVTIQAKQPLHFRLIIWGNSNFDNVDLNAEKYIGEVDLDLTEEPAYQIAGIGQYRLNSEKVDINYQDFGALTKLYLGLMNVSITPKNAGIAGEVQLNIKMSPRV
jgi:hypothetical protein